MDSNTDDPGAHRIQEAGAGAEAGAPGEQRAERWRQRGPRPLTFVLVLTGVVMVIAVIVAVWMYWLAPALTV